MLVIRLSRTGRTKQPNYRIVVADKRAAATGRHIEVLGHYNPRTKEFGIDEERTKLRLEQGAQPSETATALLARAGLMKHEITDQNRRPTRQPRKAVEEAPVAAEATDETPAEGDTPAEAPEATEAPSEETTTEQPAEAKTEEVAEEPADTPAEPKADEAAQEAEEPAEEAATDEDKTE